MKNEYDYIMDNDCFMIGVARKTMSLFISEINPRL